MIIYNYSNQYTLNKKLTKTKVIETIARYYGTPISISNLVLKIRERYSSGFYPNINKVVHTLLNERILKISKIGRPSMVTLNYENPALLDLLTEAEIENKYHISSKYPQLGKVLSEINFRSKPLNYINSISATNSEKNIKLNRIELLILFKSVRWLKEGKISKKSAYSAELKNIKSEKLELSNALQSIYNIHNIRIDYLILNTTDFFELLKSDEINQVKEMLPNKITILNPQLFWMEFIDMIKQGISMDITKSYDADFTETKPISIAEKDLTFNLSRFGYTEFGTKIVEGNLISIEYIITSILMHEEPRRIEAIPIIMKKNISRINVELLVFLCKKYNVLKKLLNTLYSRADNWNNAPSSNPEEKLNLYNASRSEYA